MIYYMGPYMNPYMDPYMNPYMDPYYEPLLCTYTYPSPMRSNLMENERKQGVSICRKMQGNKVFQSAEKYRETMCFKLLKKQGNKVFQSAEMFKETMRLNLMENERKRGVSICWKMQGNKVSQPAGKCRETMCFKL